MAEKRKFDRLQVSLAVVYRPVKKYKRQKTFSSVVKNIGGGGLCFEVEEDFVSGTLLDLQIEIPHLSKPIHATGEVVRFARRAEEGPEIREVGVLYRDIEPEDLHKILEYVHAIGIG